MGRINVAQVGNLRKQLNTDARFPHLNIIGDIPSQSEAETVQFERILSDLDNHSEDIGPWNLVILDWPYHRILSDSDDQNVNEEWWGQIDFVLISEKKIIVYELKGYTVTKLNKAWANRKDWFIEKQNKPGRVIREKSFFNQCSRCHKYLLDFLEDELRPYIDWPCHFDVDVRLVFKAGSDTDNFRYSPPRKINKDSFEESLAIIDTDQANILKHCYTLYGETYILNYLSPAVFNRLASICNKEDLHLRTSKWFKIIKENELINDLNDNTGSERMLLPNLVTLIEDDNISLCFEG